MHEPERFRKPSKKNAIYNSINMKYTGMNLRKIVQKPHGDKTDLNKWRCR